MLVHTRAHPTKRVFEVSLKRPGGQKVLSYIPLEYFDELKSLIKDIEENDSIKWSDAAKESIECHKQAGIVLRGARFRENMTQKELAKKSGVSQENISRIENGKRTVGRRLAKKLAKPLKINYLMLMENDIS